MKLIKMFMYRLLVYPIISSLIWLYIYTKHHDFFPVQVIEQSVLKSMPIPLDEKWKFVLFGFAFGYLYGTISVGIKVRKFRGLLFPLIFLAKVMTCLCLGLLAMFVYPIEVFLLLLGIMLFKNKFFSNEKKIKAPKEFTKKQESDRESIKQEILNELKNEYEITKKI